jgi:hypothetical protein
MAFGANKVSMSLAIEVHGCDLHLYLLLRRAALPCCFSAPEVYSLKRRRYTSLSMT